MNNNEFNNNTVKELAGQDVYCMKKQLSFSWPILLIYHLKLVKGVEENNLFAIFLNFEKLFLATATALYTLLSLSVLSPFPPSLEFLGKNSL